MAQGFCPRCGKNIRESEYTRQCVCGYKFPDTIKFNFETTSSSSPNNSNITNNYQQKLKSSFDWGSLIGSAVNAIIILVFIAGAICYLFGYINKNPEKVKAIINIFNENTAPTCDSNAVYESIVAKIFEDLEPKFRQIINNFSMQVSFSEQEEISTQNNGSKRICKANIGIRDKNSSSEWVTVRFDYIIESSANGGYSWQGEINRSDHYNLAMFLLKLSVGYSMDELIGKLKYF